MPYRKTITAYFFFILFCSGFADPRETNFLYSKYALDGVPLAILESTKEDEVWVVTDAASLIQLGWEKGIQKILPLRKGVQGSFPRPSGGVLIWFVNGEVQSYDSSGTLVLKIEGSHDSLRQAWETTGGYTVVEEEGNRVGMYSLSGNKLLEWKREGGQGKKEWTTLLPLQIVSLSTHEEDVVLDAQSSGSCTLWRIDGVPLTRLQFPHPLQLVSFVHGKLLLGVSPEGRGTLLSLEGKEIRRIDRIDRILNIVSPSFPKMRLEQDGTVSYMDPDGIFHSIPLLEDSGAAPLSIPLDLKGGNVTAFSVSSRWNSFWVGDSQWVLHWFRPSGIRVRSGETLGQNRDTSGISGPAADSPPPHPVVPVPKSPAEQYFLDLAQSPFLQKNQQLIEEARESLQKGTLRSILLGLRRGLRTLTTRKELGAALRVEAIQLLGSMGDRFDGEWLGKRLILETDSVVLRSILESLYRLSNAPPASGRKDLFLYLRNRRIYLSLIELQRSLTLLKRWIQISDVPLQDEELDQLAALATLSSSFQNSILEFLRK